MQAPKCCSEGKPRLCQHCCSLAADEVAQELLAAEMAKLGEAAAKRQKKTQTRSKKQEQKKQLHLASEVPQENVDVAADKSPNSGAGPST